MAAGLTYEPISTTTLGSNQASVTLSNLGGYTDLRIILNIKLTAGGLGIRPNGDTSSIYSMTNMNADGTTRFVSRLNTSDLGGTGFYLANSSISTSNFHIVTLDFLSYSNSTTYKTITARFNNTNGKIGLAVGTMQGTSPITSLNFAPDGGGNIVSGSSITAYGITAA